MSSNMQMKQRIQAKRLRWVRKIHRTTGIILFVILLIIAITGIFLGWKKNTNGLILPETQKGQSSEFENWMSLDSLHTIAIKAFNDSLNSNKIPTLNKIDVRKEKGIVKFVFEDGYWGIQLDGTTGEVLQIERRWSDLIENIHDGSLLDNFFGSKSGFFKLTITTSAGIGILIFVITGFWLWYVPREIRKKRKSLF